MTPERLADIRRRHATLDWVADLLAALDTATERAERAEADRDALERVTSQALIDSHDKRFAALVAEGDRADTVEAALVALREAGRRHEKALSGQQNYNWHERDTALLAFIAALASTPADLAATVQTRERAVERARIVALLRAAAVSPFAYTNNLLREIADSLEAKP